MIFHGLGIGFGIVEDFPCIVHPGDAGAGGFQAVKVVQSFCRNPLGCKGGLGLKLLHLDLGKIAIKGPQNQGQTGQ